MPATTPCSRCGKDITGYPCAFCGARSSSIGVSISGKGLKSGLKVLAVVLGIFWALGMVLVVFDTESAPKASNTDTAPEATNAEPEPEPEHDAVGAWVVCENFVEDRLRAPATADFPCCYSDFVTHEGGGVYRAEAYVDAENAFGAMLRSDFTCTVEHRSSGRWRLRDLEITER